MPVKCKEKGVDKGILHMYFITPKIFYNRVGIFKLNIK